MKTKCTLTLLAVLPLAGFSLSASAQIQTTAMPKQEQEHILVTAETDENTPNIETLSGIHLKSFKKGGFRLDFAQELKEDGVLAITNKAGKVVYTKPVSIADKKYSWSYHLGRLKPDTYQVEVKTSDTSYWSKFIIRK